MNPLIIAVLAISALSLLPPDDMQPLPQSSPYSKCLFVHDSSPSQCEGYRPNQGEK